MVTRLLSAVALVTATALSQGHPPPGVTPFGAGCGSYGRATRLSLSHGLRPGTTSVLTLANMRPQVLGALWTGWSRSQWGSLPLPLDLGFAGMPTCELLVAAQAPVGFGTGNGSQQCALGVPLSPVVVGAELAMQATFYDPWANAPGLVWSHALAARIGPMPAATSMVTSISQFGITYQFASPVRAGRFVNGDWFVVGPAQLTGMSPPVATQNGRVLNGAMINPDPSTRDHGYDSALYGPANAHHYVPALNVALGLSPASPLTLQPNQSLVKTISNTDPTLVPYLRTCSVLTCVAAVPAHDSFRPPYSGPDHEVRFDSSMLDWTALAQLQPAPNMPVIATEAARFERPWLDHCPGWASRVLHPAENMPDYGRDLAAVYNQATLLCNLAVPQQDKRTLVVRLVQIGIDFWGNSKNGGWWDGTGGHGSGRKWPILFAGRMLQDTEMLRVGYSHPTYRNHDGTYEVHFGEDGQTFYVEQTGPNEINWGHGGYTAQHLGMPEYGFSHTHWPAADHEPWMQDPYRRCCTANAWIGGVLCVRVMGLVQAWNHPALFDYMDRFAATEPSGWTREWLPWTGRMWDLHRASF